MEIIAQDSGAKIVVNPLIFNYEYNEGLVHQSVVTFMNNARSGDSAQKLEQKYVVVEESHGSKRELVVPEQGQFVVHYGEGAV